MKTINVKGEVVVWRESGAVTYLSDHEMSEADLLIGIATALKRQQELKTAEDNMRRLLLKLK